MANTIGEKIKEIRKELNLTQSELAGNEMTKSMLSQIENNQASPSMKNLLYIASRLNRPISYFLDENPQGIVNPLPIDEINSVIRRANDTFNRMDISGALEIIEDLLQKYNFDKKDKLYGEILSIKSKCLVHLKRFDEGEKDLQEAFDLFLNNHLYIEAAKTHTLFTEKHFQSFDYEKCLKIIAKSEEIYNCSTKKDTVFEIDLIFEKIVIHTSMGNVAKGLKLMERAINIAKETNIYYKTDRIYRAAGMLYLYDNKFEKFLHCAEKATLFAKFADDKQSLGMIAYQRAIYENEMNNPKAALEHLKFHEENVHKLTFMYYIEMAKSYYLLNEYEKSLENLNMVDYSFYASHRLDYFEMWSGKIYEGLVLHKLGKSSEGIECINYGIQKIEVFKNSKELAFAYKSLSDIYSDTCNFQDAFIALKKADEIKSSLNKE